MTLKEALETRKMGALLKHSHVFDIYESHLAHLQEYKLKILEIGVYNGGSLFMWKNYFPNATIVGMDIDSYCTRWEDKSNDIHIVLGDQSDPARLIEINEQYGPFDIIIDDGGHENHQVITSFETLFPLLKEGGLYFVEDVFCSYWPEYTCNKDETTAAPNEQGVFEEAKPITMVKAKYDKRTSSMEFLKSLADATNAWAYKKGGKGEANAGENLDSKEWNAYEKSLYSLHFYDGLVVAMKFSKLDKNSYGKITWYDHIKA